MRTGERTPHAGGVRRAVTLAAALLAVSGSGRPARAAEAGVLVSHRAASDFALDADPRAPEWKGIEGVIADRDRQGRLVPGHRTEIRSRWTEKSLYLLFVAPYEDLYVKPDPQTTADTDKLWEFDVAEAFIGTDFHDIKKYKEFQVSPQGEWVDLAIDRGADPPQHDRSWNSGYEVKARIDRAKRVWYGEMRIPFSALDMPAPRVGAEARLNLFRWQGPPQRHRDINWQVVHNDNFHTPEAFGRLRLDR
jgi:Carbohydrate family 9 binding domain-like